MTGALWRAVAGALLGQLVLGIVRPVISYRALELGADEFVIGVLVACYGVLPLVAAIWLGRFAGRASRIASTAFAGAGLQLVACVVAASAPGLAGLAVASALLGLGNLAVLIGAQAWLSRSLEASKYDGAFGLLTAGMSLGQAIGPLVGGLVVDSGGTVTTLWVATAFALAVIFAFLSPARAPAAAGNGHPGSLAMLRAPGFLRAMFVSVSILTSVDLLGAYLPVIGQQHSISATLVGALLAVRGFASAVPRLLLPLLVSRWSRDVLVIASTTGAALTVAIVAIAAPVPVLFAAMAGGGFLLGLGQPLTMSLVAVAVPQRARSSALALRLLGNRVAQTALPVMAGTVAGGVGVASVFWLQCALLVSATAWSVSARVRNLRG